MCKEDISNKKTVNKIRSPRRSPSNNSDDISSVHHLLSSDGSDLSLSSNSTEGNVVMNTEPQVVVEDLEETVMFEEATPSGQVAIDVEEANDTY